MMGTWHFGVVSSDCYVTNQRFCQRRYAAELAKLQMEADDAEHRCQQGLLHLYALDATTQGPSNQPFGSSNGTNGSSYSSQLGCNPIRIVGMSATLPNAEEVGVMHSSAAAAHKLYCCHNAGPSAEACRMQLLAGATGFRKRSICQALYQHVQLTPLNLPLTEVVPVAP
jgi:hypothetical protein